MSIEDRRAQSKSLLLEQLKKTPIVQIACEKAGVGRATYYRWRKEDASFSEQADQAINDGSGMVNDMAESQLMAAIRDRNLTAIIFWLKHHHPAYATKVEVHARLESKQIVLSPEQAELVRQALEKASLATGSEITNDQTYELQQPREPSPSGANPE